MKVNIIGSNTVGYVGEKADEVCIAEAFQGLGHDVTFVPRDIWKAYVEGTTPNDDWVLPEPADVSIICKWHHFTGQHVEALKKYGPVFYWTWDWMQWPLTHEWHESMVTACDVHLTNDAMSIDKTKYPNVYYFPMDCADGHLNTFQGLDKIYDVVFFGSCLDQGVRKEYLEEINKHCNLTVFAWNHEEWKKLGIEAYPAVWGEAFNKVVAQSKICLQFSVNDDIWGYWSNRVGKILYARGFLLARYAPGMEMFVDDGAVYFRTVEDAIVKIEQYLDDDSDRELISSIGAVKGMDFTFRKRVKQLEVLIERYYDGRTLGS